MNKRLIAIALWFYSGWAFGALVATATGVNALIGPMTGVILAGVILWNPGGRNTSEHL